MKTLNYAIFWAVCALVMVPVFLGLMSNELTPALLALAWGGGWWWLFSSTKIGRRAFIKGYKITCGIMQDC